MNTKASLQYKFPKVDLQPLTSQIIEYFEKRGISQETLDTYGVSSDKNGNIVFGMLALKNVGKQFVESIIRERASAPFEDFED